MEVTADLIKEMRKNGKGYEAEKLLEAWRKNGKKNKEQLRKEIIANQRRKETIIAKKNHLCIKCKKSLAINGTNRCEKCAEYWKKAYAKIRDWTGWTCAVCGTTERQGIRRKFCSPECHHLSKSWSHMTEEQKRAKIEYQRRRAKERKLQWS